MTDASKGAHEFEQVPVTRRGAFQALKTAFEEGGIDTPDLDARILLCRLGDFSFEDLVRDPDVLMPQSALEALEQAKGRRLSGEPVSRLLGERSFWHHDFLLNSETLDPRADTETLVEAALAFVSGDEISTIRPYILDIGTGTGCILISLLTEWPDAFGVGLDVSEKALRAAQVNAVRAGVQDRVAFVAGDWLASVNARFDLIVSNPPYIPSKDIEGLAPEVRRFDPRRALDGGESGLEAYRNIAPVLPGLLSPRGAVLFEVGAGQAEEVRDILSQFGIDAQSDWACAHSRRDLAGHQRVVAGRPRS